MHSLSSILIFLPPHWHSYFRDQLENKETGIPDRSKSPSFCTLPCVSIYVLLERFRPAPCETELNHRAAQTMESVSRLWKGLTRTSGTKTRKTNPERCLHLLLFVSARDEINEDHLFGKAMTVKTWRHRIMSAVCTVSGSFTWRFLDRVGLAMMDIVLVIQTLLNCVCVCKPEGCAPQGSVYEKKWFRVNSSDKWHGLSLDGGCAAPRLYMVNLRNLCIKLRWHCILQPRLQEK